MTSHESRGAGAVRVPGVVLRRLSSHEDYAACVELQRQTWGAQFAETVPGSILKISQRAGGIAAGAFGEDGNLLGFVYGLTGVRPGARPGARRHLIHWSHMLAVAPAGRDRGLGRSLKLYQRELLLPLGVKSVEWTYDPLEARNAHLNLNRLGATVSQYVRDMYEGEMGSELARGIGTDRFIVAWRIASGRVREALAAGSRRVDAGAFAVAPVAGDPGAPGGALPDARRVRIEVPADIQELKARRPEAAAAWRQATRLAFESYLDRGYRVKSFFVEGDDNRSFYGLEQGAGRG